MDHHKRSEGAFENRCLIALAVFTAGPLDELRRDFRDGHPKGVGTGSVGRGADELGQKASVGVLDGLGGSASGTAGLKSQTLAVAARIHIVLSGYPVIAELLRLPDQQPGHSANVLKTGSITRLVSGSRATA